MIDQVRMTVIDAIVDDADGDIDSRVSSQPSRYDVQIMFGWSIQLTSVLLNDARRNELASLASLFTRYHC